MIVTLLSTLIYRVYGSTRNQPLLVAPATTYAAPLVRGYLANFHDTTKQRWCYLSSLWYTVKFLCFPIINIGITNQALIGWFVVWAALVSIPPGHGEQRNVIRMNLVRWDERRKAAAVRHV